MAQSSASAERARSSVLPVLDGGDDPQRLDGLDVAAQVGEELALVDHECAVAASNEMAADRSSCS